MYDPLSLKIWSITFPVGHLNLVLHHSQISLDSAVLTYLAVLFDTAALVKLCLAVLTSTLPDFVKTAVGTKFLLGCG
ncbi:hypothetical protein Tco_0202178, partial [Tanacetum coccineum]